MNLLLLVHLSLVMEPHPFELDRWCPLLKGGREIHILRDDASVEQADHALIDILLRNRRRVLHLFLLFQVLFVSDVPNLPALHDLA